MIRLFVFISIIFFSCQDDPVGDDNSNALPSTLYVCDQMGDKVLVLDSSTDDLDQLPEKAFAKFSGMLRSELSKEIKIRRVPKLVFKYDESIEYASKIEKLLESIK